MRLLNFIIVCAILKSACPARLKDLSTVLHGFFSSSDPTSISYASFDLQSQQFNNIGSLSINDVGNPKNLKYSNLPMAYDPNHDIIYIAAPVNPNVTILSAINAASGQLSQTFKMTRISIVSLQYNIFQNRLYAHLEYPNTTTFIGEIDTDKGTIINHFADLVNFNATPISSYCPISEEYFLMMSLGESYYFIVVSTNIQTSYSTIPINFIPVNMRYDYKTSSMYTVYADQPDQFIASIGMFNRMTGRISEFYQVLNIDPSIHLTSLTAYDISQRIYYTLTQSSNSTSKGVYWIQLDSPFEHRAYFPSNVLNSYGWFVKMFGDTTKLY